MITGRIRKLIDAVLIDDEPVASADRFPDKRL
jgi:hypothetical protein